MGDVTVNRAAGQPSVQQNRGPAGPAAQKGVSSAQARANQEAAFDAAFTHGAATVSIGEQAAGAAVINTSEAVDVALAEFRRLAGSFLSAPPRGEVAEAFALGFQAAHFEGEPVSTTATGSPLFFDANTLPPSEKNSALALAYDKYWTKVMGSIPTAEALAANPTLAALRAPAGAQAIAKITPALTAVMESIVREQGSKAKAADDEEDATITVVGEVPSEDRTKAEAALKAGFEHLFAKLDTSGIDIMALVQMVMMECAKDNQVDLREAMKAMQKRNAEKKEKREQISAMKREKADMEAILRDEMARDEADGRIPKGLPFETYCAHRTIVWGAYDKTTGKIVPRSQVVPHEGPYAPAIGTGATLDDLFNAMSSDYTKQLTPGESGPHITQLQTVLALAGYDVSPNGTFDAKTEAAVQKLRADAGLPAGSSADAQTISQALAKAGIIPQELATFYANSGTIGEGMSNDPVVVSQLQTMMKTAGFDVDVTGTVDAKTLAAIKAADPTRGLNEADGGIGHAAIFKLYAAAPNMELNPVQVFKAYGSPADSVAPGEGQAQASIAAFQAEIEAAQSELDTLGDMSQEDSLKLQMVMERYNKCFEIASNLAKKASSVSDTITNNLK